MENSYLEDIEKGLNEIFRLLKNPYVKLDINKIDIELILCDMRKLIKEIKRLKKENKNARKINKGNKQ